MVDAPTHDAVLAHARALLGASRRAVALTGAGLSTESGIPDFRSPGGVWERFRPIEYGDFVRSSAARREHWRYKMATVPVMLEAQPNAGHRALARLERAGRLEAVVTQNIDGLHQAAGSGRVLELHGTNRSAVCLQCDRLEPIEPVLARVAGGDEEPRCDACGGILKPATVSFGQSLPRGVLEESIRLAETCDCLLAIGSSLQVQPAASLVEIAKRAGATVLILTRSATPYDRIADAKLDGALGATLPALVEGALRGDA
ncbi:Sir2 family NAD-dependent protein deacetylase [Candidatus Binatia bacterium]|nr:Sir2 family NAD-dependent protein deacetylase [Candidatus Binatia bacterium]